METFQCANQLSRIEPRPSLGKPLFLPQVIEELPSVKEVHDEVQLLVCLERVVQVNDERACDLLHDLPLDYTHLTWHILTLSLDREVPCGYLVLAEDFHCEDFPIRPFLNHVHFAETAAPYDLHHNEVFLRDLAALKV